MCSADARCICWKMWSYSIVLFIRKSYSNFVIRLQVVIFCVASITTKGVEISVFTENNVHNILASRWTTCIETCSLNKHKKLICVDSLLFCVYYTKTQQDIYLKEEKLAVPTEIGIRCRSACDFMVIISNIVLCLKLMSFCFYYRRAEDLRTRRSGL
jgi:hypothetical protein